MSTKTSMGLATRRLLRLQKLLRKDSTLMEEKDLLNGTLHPRFLQVSNFFAHHPRRHDDYVFHYCYQISKITNNLERLGFVATTVVCNCCTQLYPDDVCFTEHLKTKHNDLYKTAAYVNQLRRETSEEVVYLYDTPRERTLFEHLSRIPQFGSSNKNLLLVVRCVLQTMGGCQLFSLFDEVAIVQAVVDKSSSVAAPFSDDFLETDFLPKITKVVLAAVDAKKKGVAMMKKGDAMMTSAVTTAVAAAFLPTASSPLSASAPTRYAGSASTTGDAEPVPDETTSENTGAGAVSSSSTDRIDDAGPAAAETGATTSETEDSAPTSSAASASNMDSTDDAMLDTAEAADRSSENEASAPTGSNATVSFTDDAERVPAANTASTHTCREPTMEKHPPELYSSTRVMLVQTPLC